MPEVSVIIPTHNRGEFLRTAVASVLGQTLQDFEVIVVDDASEDDTQEVVKSFADSRIRYIRHETNKGVSAARNTGILNSYGKYIAFLDDDDEWLANKLRIQCDLLENSPAEVGGVYTGAFYVDGSSGKVRYQFLPAKGGNRFDDMLIRHSVAPTSTFLVRKDCFEAVGLFDVDLRFGEDFDMWLRIVKEFRLEYLAEPLIKFAIPGHKPSLSADYNLMIKSSEAELRKFAEFFALHGKIHSLRYLGLGALYCYSGNTRKGREAFIRGIRIWPFEARHYFNFGLSLLGAKNFKKLKTLKEQWLAR